MLGLEGKNGKVSSLAFSPDGRLLASASWNWVLAGREDVGEVRLRDLTTGEERILGGRPRSACAVAFSPDGKTLASGGWDQRVTLWDVPSGRRRSELTGPPRPVVALTFSPSGAELVAGCADLFPPDGDAGGAISWPFTGLTGLLGLSLSLGVNTAVRSVAFSPSGKTLALGCGGGVLLRPSSGRTTMLEQDGPVRAVAFSPDGRLLAAASPYDVHLWDVAARKVVATLKGHYFLVWSVAFAPDGRTLLTGSWDMTVRLWEVATGRELRKLNWDIGKVQTVAFAPDGMRAAAGGDDRDVVVWDVDDTVG